MYLRGSYTRPMGLVIKFGLVLLILLALGGYLLYRRILGNLEDIVTKVVVATHPDEIHLVRDRQIAWQDREAVAAQVQALCKAGFRTVTSYRIEELDEIRLVGLAHPEKGWAAAVYEHDQAGVWSDLVAEYQDGGELTVSNPKEGGKEPSPSGHDKVILEKAPVARLLRVFEKRLGGRPVAPIGAANFAENFERSWARNMVWRRQQEAEAAGAETLERDPELDLRCEPLFAAIAAGRLQPLQVLLDTGIEPEGRDRRGRTPLIAAAAAGNLPMVQALLTAGAGVNARAPGDPGQGFEGGAPLATVAEDIDDPEAQKVMKGLGALVDASQGPSQLNVTALSAATESGSVEVVNALIGAGADLIGRDDLTPLQFAAQQGDPDVVRALLAGGAAPDQPGEDDWTPMMSAAFEGFTGVVRVLLDAGAEPNRKSGRETAILIAADEGHHEIVEMLSPLVKTRLARKAEKRIAESEDFQFDPAAKRLMTAASNGVTPMVEKLLASGVHPDALESDDEDDEVVTPLMMAAQGGHADVLRALLAAGAAVDGPVDGYETALARAASPPTFMDPGDQPETVRVLVEAGASLERLDEEAKARVQKLLAPASPPASPGA